MFIAPYGARPEIMHEVQRPLTMPVHPERIEFESPQLQKMLGDLPPSSSVTGIRFCEACMMSGCLSMGRRLFSTV
jgi:hypothetical protein